ncbi:DUF2975 domain-containing protein [Nocardiopsis sediminis]|uniref:DUF2975 domain-containing protein n=1 Tax=Nocardiopsis sediminis TaxID=1778267 RepID=A0ABV8FPW4_9ACTN
MDRFFIFLLRSAAVLAILIGFFGQFVVIPGAAAEQVALFPPYAPYATSYITLSILGVACVQVALVGVWMLLAVFRRDAVFTPKAFLWVDVIIGATLVATLLTAGVAVHLTVGDVPSANGAMGAVGAMGTAVVLTGTGAAVAMLLFLMRGLLRKAMDLQTEMAEVV